MPDQMQPGLYHAEPSESCFWARLSSSDGGSTSNDTITNGNNTGPLTIQVKSGDAAFKSSGCGEWQKVTATDGTVAEQFGTGIYLVGRDIGAGHYQTNGQDSCYWAVMRDAGMATIIANDNTAGPAMITVADGEAVESSSCGTWTKSG